MADRSGLEGVQPITAVDTATTIAGQLRELLASGRFAPGVQITEQAVADAFQVSRGPVREAMKRLIEQGLLHAERNRGVFAPQISVEDVEDIYLLRGAIESAALALLARRRDPKVLSRLRALIRQYKRELKAKNWEVADDLDLAFHRELVESTGSRRLSHAFDTLAVETRMCLKTVVFNHPDHPDMDRWHLAILEAVERGNLTQAVKALNFHNDTVIADLTANARSGKSAEMSI